jgi:hypothetical protein
MLLFSTAHSRSLCVLSFQQTRLWNSVKQSCNYTTPVRSRQAWNLSHQDKPETWWKGDDKVCEASTKEGYIKLLWSCKTDVWSGIFVGKGTIFLPRRSEALGLGLSNCCLVKPALLIIAEKILAILILSRREHSYWKIGPIGILEPFRSCFFSPTLRHFLNHCTRHTVAQRRDC